MVASKQLHSQRCGGHCQLHHHRPEEIAGAESHERDGSSGCGGAGPMVVLILGSGAASEAEDDGGGRWRCCCGCSCGAGGGADAGDGLLPICGPPFWDLGTVSPPDLLFPDLVASDRCRRHRHLRLNLGDHAAAD
uniref:Uncharacterized protein n=2 Tax=Oryza TaxID=4527 RepID=A0A0D3F4Y9_9ORYZ